MPEPQQDGIQAVLDRQRIWSPLRLACCLGLLIGLGCGAGKASAQSGLNPPADAFRDAGTRALVERAIAARRREALGIQSYEATLRQRMHVGVTAFRFRRERTLFEHERVARIRWSESGEQAIRWIGVRTALPVVGLDTAEPDTDDGPLLGRDGARGSRPDGDNGDEEAERETFDDDLAGDFIDEVDFPGFDFDPAADRLTFGDDWAFHPLADTSLVHYRYSLGDTLRIELPANDRRVVLYELRVEPRRPDFELVAGSLWVDSLSAALVRATYRPARPWSLRLDAPEDAGDVPGFVGPIEAEIRYITIESSLQELSYWLPRRFAFEGEARAGGLLRIPMTLEWSVGGYVVNEPPLSIPVTGDLPEGWQREVTVEEDDDGAEVTYTVIVPTSAELRSSPELSEDFGQRPPLTFTDAEIEGLANALDGLVPAYRPFPPHVAWGLEDGQLRFNRVEGLSAGVATAIALSSRLDLDLSARIGSGDRAPNATAGLRWGPEAYQWTFEAYHALASMNDDDDPFTLANSLKNIAAGGDRGEYYRATGAALGVQRRGTSTRADLRGFYESQRAVDGTTDFSVRAFGRDDAVRPMLPAEDLDVFGARALLGWSAGTDPAGWILTSELRAEVAFGDASYRRADARVSVGHPLLLGTTGALEVAGGTSWSELPMQRSFFLGASQTLRGFFINEHRGTAFWRARGEVGSAFAGARLSLFSDVGWVGERSNIRLDDPLAAIGVGASLLDGLVRFDLARAVRGSDRWKVHLYLDGLL